MPQAARSKGVITTYNSLTVCDVMKLTPPGFGVFTNSIFLTK
jgi:hypothetical protein